MLLSLQAGQLGDLIKRLARLMLIDVIPIRAIPRLEVSVEVFPNLPCPDMGQRRLAKEAVHGRPPAVLVQQKGLKIAQQAGQVNLR